MAVQDCLLGLEVADHAAADQGAHIEDLHIGDAVNGLGADARAIDESGGFEDREVFGDAGLADAQACDQFTHVVGTLLERQEDADAGFVGECPEAFGDAAGSWRYCRFAASYSIQSSIPILEYSVKWTFCQAIPAKG